MSKRIRLTDGFHRAVDEDSSSGCSSSGPAAMRNYIPSPVSPNTGIPMFAVGRKSPLNSTATGGAEKTPARYLPYTIRPLVLRAKRKLQNESNSLATSTARRIMTALDRSATPVVDSIKVHYDPVVASRPVFTPLRRNNLGPPILKSPMVPAPTPKIVYNPSMHIHIPKLVDFGTNTDLTMGTITTLDALRSNISMDECNGTPYGMFKYSLRGGEESGGGKMKSFSTRIHTPSLRSKSTVDDSKNLAVSKPESKYKFSKAWTSEELKSKLSTTKFDSVEEAKSSLDINVCSKCRGETATASSEIVPAKPISTESVNVTQKPKEDTAGKQWECPVCMVQNKPDQLTCPCCGEKKPSISVTQPPKSLIPAVTMSSGLSTSWSSVKPAQSAQSGKNWDCPTCMVSNTGDAKACVCCSEKNPNATSILAKWDCPTCMVSNKGDAAACVCCSEKNPNAASIPVSTSTSSTAVATAASAFKFGFTSAPSQTAENKLGTSQDASVKSNFTFGSQPVSSVTTNSPPPKSTFSFGTNADAAATAAAPTSSFKFGDASKSVVSEAPAATSTPKGFFGTTASNSGFGGFGAVTSPAFGGATNSSITSPTLRSSVGSPTNSEIGKTQPMSSFSFGSPAPVSSVPSVKPSDQWNCEQCPAKSLSASECVGCGASKPKERSSSSQGSSSKRFHFAPFSGGRPEPKPEDSVDARGEPELKRKVPSSSSGSSLGFAYTPPTEVTLKMKSPVPPLFGGFEGQAPTATTSAFSPNKDAGGPKAGNFLDALKTGQQFSFQTPAPGTSVIPSVPLGGSVAVSPAQSSTLGSTSNNGFSSSLVSSTTGPPAGLFQMTAPSTQAPSFGQSSSAVLSSNPVTSISSSTSGFNILGNNSLKPGGFSFGSGSGGLSNGPSAAAPQTQPLVFGSSTPSSGGSSAIFGMSQPTIQQQPNLGLGSGGQSGAPQPLGNSMPTLSAPAPQFNVSAPPSTFNFGIPQPGSFSFTAQPSPGGGGATDIGARKIRKATRRTK